MSAPRLALLLFSATVWSTSGMVIAAETLTLERIMANPDWIGNAPENAYFSADSKTIFYTQKADGSEQRELWQVAAKGGTPTKVDSQALARVDAENKVWDRAHRRSAWTQAGNVWLHDGRDARQLTRTGDIRGLIGFVGEDWLAWRAGNRLLGLNIRNGDQRLFAELRTEDDPAKKEPSKDYLSQQQTRLFDIIKLRKARDDARREQEKQLAALPESAPTPFYFGKGKDLRTVSLSPDGRWLLVGTEAQNGDGKADTMPHYVSEDGYVRPQPVRSKVGTDKPENETLFLIDLNTRNQRELALKTLPGISEDPLLALKTETAKAAGKEPPKGDAQRAVYVSGFGRGQVQWQDDSSELAFNLMSYDNKDRWLVSVPVQSAELRVRHRLTDNAWVNDSAFTEFGWLADGTLWYLSETSGYGHLYTDRKGQITALTQGAFEVSRVQLTPDEQWFYFRGNREHPGLYEVYRVASKGGAVERVTALNGGMDFVLSPDGKQLALLHSKMTQPTELYLQAAKPGSDARRSTFTVKPEFTALQLPEPEIVPVPSSHGAKLPVYARVYRDKNRVAGEKQPAVMFVHGAGYLQNVHYGWSTYFREFLFHYLLVQKGYVVIDMDYRASQGYGRDWRTAIYQQMGTPELEDYLDGVEWLVANANVDRQKIGIYGGSYGGFMTFMALFKTPDVFAAGAALRPVTDWAHYNHGYTANILNTPDVDPQAYLRSSPIEFAANLKKPLLICTGMLDDNVFFQDSVRLVQRLIELKNANFDLAVYPIEPHGFREPESWLDEYRRIFRLFEKELRGVEVRFN